MGSSLAASRAGWKPKKGLAATVAGPPATEAPETNPCRACSVTILPHRPPAGRAVEAPQHFLIFRRALCRAHIARSVRLPVRCDDAKAVHQPLVRQDRARDLYLAQRRVLRADGRRLTRFGRGPPAFLLSLDANRCARSSSPRGYDSAVSVGGRQTAIIAFRHRKATFARSVSATGPAADTRDLRFPQSTGPRGRHVVRCAAFELRKMSIEAATRFPGRIGATHSIPFGLPGGIP